MTPSYLYCLEAVGSVIAKVGTANRPMERLSSLRSAAPFDMKFRHVVRFDDREMADAWEAHIICKARRYRERGEWVYADAKLDGLFGEVTDGVICTDRFRFDEETGRRIPQEPDTESRILRTRLRAQVGPGLVHAAGFNGQPSDYNLAVIRARVADGYGIEDIAVMDKLDVNYVRSVVLAHADPRP